MATYVGESTHGSLLIAKNDQGFIEKIETEIIAGVGDVRNMANNLPGAFENALLFQIEELCMAIGPCRQAHADLVAGCTLPGLIHGIPPLNLDSLNQKYGD